MPTKTKCLPWQNAYTHKVILIILYYNNLLTDYYIDKLSIIIEGDHWVKPKTKYKIKITISNKIAAYTPQVFSDYLKWKFN